MQRARPRPLDEAARHAQYRILQWVALGYYSCFLFLGRDRAWIAATSLAVMAFAYEWPRRMGRDTTDGGEPLLFAVVAGGAYIPALVVPGGTDLLGFLLALGGVVIGEAFWVVGRFAVRKSPAQSLERRLRVAVRDGSLLALGLSLYAAAVYAVFGAAGAGEPPESLAIVGMAYLVAALLGGLAIGTLRPLVDWPLGLIAVGLIGGFIVSLCLSLTLPLLEPEPESLDIVETFLIAAIAGGAGGPPVAFGLKYRA